jgi:hypothetical protein
MLQLFARLDTNLSVPSPLAGSEASEARSRGQGEGCHTTRSLGWTSDNWCTSRTPFAEPPLSPALPRKGGGSEMRSLSGHRSTSRKMQRGFP